MLFSSSVLCLLTLLPICEAGPVITTSQGDVEGMITEGVKEYLGIPYAKADRFSDPYNVLPWHGIYNATIIGPSCPQLPAGGPFNVIGKTDEDCLYLNIFTPGNATNNSKFPVMVWIHGGAFNSGSGSAPLYSGTHLAKLYNVVTVTLNYRIGILGYLTIPGTEMKGNYGVRDQIFALKWIKENIKNFGGNPEKVTIFGESAGGSSASVLFLSPLAKGLFHQAIFQSGTSTWPEISGRYGDVKTLEKFAREVSCPLSPKSALIKCLKGKTVDEIVEGQKAPGLAARYATLHVDGEVLPDFPEKLLHEGKFNKVPCIIGVNKNEGAVFVRSKILGLGMNISAVKNGISKQVFREIINKTFQHEGQTVLDAVTFEYSDWLCDEEDCPVHNRQAAVDAIGDYQFYSTADYEAKSISATGTPVFFYVFTYPSVWADFSDWLKPTHGSEIEFVFGRPLDSSPSAVYSQTDKNFSEVMMSAWTSFAKTGNPNNPQLKLTWPMFETKSSHNQSQYLELNTQLKLGQKYRAHKMAFWNEYVPQLRDVKNIPINSCSSGANQLICCKIHQTVLLIVLIIWLRAC